MFRMVSSGTYKTMANNSQIAFLVYKNVQLAKNMNLSICVQSLTWYKIPTFGLPMHPLKRIIWWLIDLIGG